MVLPADDQPTKLMQPSKKPLHSPTTAIACRSEILVRFSYTCVSAAWGLPGLEDVSAFWAAHTLTIDAHNL
jgi:hypothetical protein